MVYNISKFKPTNSRRGETEMKKKVAVVMPVKNEEGIQDLLKKIFSSIIGYNTSVVLVVDDNSTPTFRDLVATIAQEDSRVYALRLGQIAPRTFAYAYLRGLRYAVEEMGADFIVEMDAGGSHDPRALPLFVKGLEEAGAVFSTRFSHGGKMIHPLQRKLASLAGTLLANLLLGLGRFVPDMTSGYESFRGEVLQRLLELVPPDTWISVNEDPGHFYQTEMRAYLCWMEAKISLVPIVMGEGKVRKPQTLGPKKLLRAFKNLLALRKRRRRFLAQLSQT